MAADNEDVCLFIVGADPEREWASLAPLRRTPWRGGREMQILPRRYSPPQLMPMRHPPLMGTLSSRTFEKMPVGSASVFGGEEQEMAGEDERVVTFAECASGRRVLKVAPQEP
ncbi:hypothetical protein HPB50_009893 [Hyalomma asiaticum]|uniref:Uncharacterized protein n=1 Tax=Hyalomma asiaticum TaxID=266040 RepID=A0ACB7RL58_HYAAI|nr:hypothetical protein HPB50_009893 [Hyalomma asiaticum]